MSDLIFRKQLFRHDEAAGVFGDCQRTVFANLFGLRPEDVPHFHDRDAERYDGEPHLHIRRWLAERGYAEFTVPFHGSWCELEALLENLGDLNPGIYFMLSGESRSGVGHVVICRDGAIVHDTALNDSGIVGPMPECGYYYESVLVPLGGAPGLAVEQASEMRRAA